MNKDWTGNGLSLYKINGCSSHCNDDRAEYDFYATHPRAVEMLLELEQFSENVWEPCAGNNMITNVLIKHGHKVRNSDIVDRTGDIEIFDFLQEPQDDTQDCDIITNPPYKYAKEFVENSMRWVKNGHKVAMFLKLTFLEGKKRRELFEKYPPKYVYVSSSRLECLKNGDMVDKNGKEMTGIGGAVCYCWYIWEKGFTGEPTIRWFN